MGDLGGPTVAASATEEEELPAGTYTVKATGVTSHRALLETSVEVACDATTNVTIDPTPRYGLTITVTGSGSVASMPAAAEFDSGTMVTLTATADDGNRFVGWSGACSGSATTCTVTISAATTVGASFELYQLTAPLIDSVELGEKTQGQAQGLGLEYYIAIEGIYPSPSGGVASPFLGELMLFAPGFAPRGWAPCDGALMSINQNTALFSLLGTMYGGNGTTNFALPNLNRAVPVGAGTIVDATIPPDASGVPSAVPTIPALALGQVVQGQIKALALTPLIAIQGIFPPRDGSANTTDQPYLGQVKFFAGNFAPKGYALANGQLLPINQNTALFSILGTMYGGNGTTNFALPDLRARAAMGAGSLTSPDAVPASAYEQPLSSSLALGATGEGQIGVQGITYAIALEGPFPSPSTAAYPPLGQVIAFAGNFAPGGYAVAAGQLVSINQNTALFSLIGTIYGGNGTTNFALPDLLARLPMGKQ